MPSRPPAPRGHPGHPHICGRTSVISEPLMLQEMDGWKQRTHGGCPSAHAGRRLGGWAQQGSEANASLRKTHLIVVQRQAQLALIGAQVVLHEVGVLQRKYMRQAVGETLRDGGQAGAPKPAPLPRGSHRVHCTGLGLTACLCSKPWRGVPWKSPAPHWWRRGV